MWCIYYFRYKVNIAFCLNNKELYCDLRVFYYAVLIIMILESLILHKAITKVTVT